MASGTARYLRYILFAFFVSGLRAGVCRGVANTSQGLAVIYFISSSSTQRLPSTDASLGGANKGYTGIPTKAGGSETSLSAGTTPNHAGGLPPATADGPRMNA